jgi:hypothetical protein
MSRQVRITIDDDEVFERLKRRKEALDLSWEDALRRGLRDSPEPPRASPADGPGTSRQSEPRPRGEASDRAGRRTGGQASGSGGPGRRRGAGEHGSGGPGPGDGAPFGRDLGEYIAREVREAVPGTPPGTAAGPPLDDEIDRLEEAEDAVLALGDGEAERVPLRVALHTGPGGLEVDVVAVRSGKGTEGMNRFADGARADVARRFASGETVGLELHGGEETYDVRPELTWARGPDGAPTVTDVAVREVVFED